jgi:NAD(P)-dependent dehydrogenase (short-subunit alcohol dehydrogenase family)
MSVVLITGCSSGIGLETAIAFAKRGDAVYATMRNLAKADRLRSRAAEEGVEVEVLQLDVTDDDSVDAAIADVEAKHGAIDILVNNAGLGHSGPIETIDLALAHELIETNVWGAVRTIRAALPAMRAKGSGVIVNVTSVAGRVPGVAYNGFYSASKHGLGAISEALLWEVAPFGIRVACVEPGFFATDIFANSARSTADMSAPYAADNAWMDEFYTKSGEAMGGDPAVVADVILRIADDPSAEMHNLVGDDATMFVDLVGQAGTFEAWLPVGTSIVEGVAGPRPVAPKPPG